jgi:predicted transposase YbfD/YdcC
MMSQSSISSLKKHFEVLKDPRAQHRIEHLLIDIVVISICAVICGAESWPEIEEYGLAKQVWLETLLELPNGIPSHDTFERLFARLKPKQMQECFINWVQSIYHIVPGEGVSLDGKALRGSAEKGNRSSLIYMVSAWATEAQLVLGQQKVRGKSNEITAIPELLKMIELESAVVTIDAMGCQRAIAEQIVSQKGDYILALKGNQGNLHDEVIHWFEQAQEKRFAGMDYDLHETQEFSHGRQERRRHWILTEIESLPGLEQWAKLTAIGCVESQRTVGEKTSTETRYYLLSLPLDAARFAEKVRGHWGIENQLHWVLDVGFREDQCRVMQDNAAANLAVIRHIAINLIKQEKSIKAGTRTKRMRAGWDDQYLYKILAQSAQQSPKV